MEPVIHLDRTEEVIQQGYDDPYEDQLTYTFSELERVANEQLARAGEQIMKLRELESKPSAPRRHNRPDRAGD